MCMGIFLNGDLLLLLFKSYAHKHRLKHISLHTKTLKTTSSAAKTTPKGLYVYNCRPIRSLGGNQLLGEQSWSTEEVSVCNDVVLFLKIV